jgi:two-component system CheB/CheR fusion protein
MGLAIRKLGHKLQSLVVPGGIRNRARRERSGGKRKHMKDTAVRKVLLVDDHQVACRSTAILLEMSGYKVRTAFNGRTAIEVAGEFSPDIIILDIGLPDIGGYELLNRLKQFKELQTTKFIALTGFEEETAQQKQTGSAFHHFLRKPVDTSQLKALLNA